MLVWPLALAQLRAVSPNCRGNKYTCSVLRIMSDNHLSRVPAIVIPC